MKFPVVGTLSTAQDLTSGSTTDSENVIQIDDLDFGSPTGLWWFVETETVATGDGSDTYQFQLLVAQEAGLDNTKEILSRTVTGYQDNSIERAGGRIVCVNIAKMINEVLGDDLSSYPYIGMISTISSGAGISINACLTNAEPPTESHSQSVTSNVGTPTVASAGSGL